MPLYFCVIGFILKPYFEIKNLKNLTVLILVGLPTPRVLSFTDILFYSYDYNMHVEGLLPDYPVFVFTYFIKLRTN